MAPFTSHCLLIVTLGCEVSAQTLAKSDNASVQLYFGSGCFFARQHLFIADFEQKVLRRKNNELTAIAGYAGSTKTGPKNSACYHNSKNFSDYDVLGDAEVVLVEVPVESVEQAFATYFNAFVEFNKGSWVRPDVYDLGAQYRSLVGVPGGISNSEVLAAMHRANVNNMTLQAGHGSDPDTLSTNNVFVMDSAKFPFIQGEECLQFHDDSQEKYSESYHKLVQGLKLNGRLKPTSCPANFICNSSSDSSHDTTTRAIMI